MKTNDNAFFVLLLLILALLFCLTGCTSVPAPQVETSPSTTLRVYLSDSGRNMSDAPLVNEKINEYILPILGFQVDIQYLPDLSYSNTIGQKFLSTEPFDILYCPTRRNINAWIQEGWLLPLDELLPVAETSLYAIYTPEFLDLFRIQDQLYALPTNRDWACDIGIEYNLDIAEAYGIDMSAVRSLEDLTAIFAQLKSQNPDIIPIAEPVAFTWDRLNDELGVLLDLSKPVVSNLYTSDEFRAYCDLTHLWYQNGYSLDMTSYSSITIDYLGSGRVFCSLSFGKPGFATQESRTTGLRIGYISLSEPFSTTQKLSSSFLGINASSAHPQESMAFLNMMYSDPYLANLMVYGIEGVHYEFKNAEKTVIGFPEGIDCTNSKYAKLLTWQYANSFLTYAWEGDPPDIWEKTDAFNQNAQYSAAFGFVFDASSVADEMEACKKIQGQYRSGLLTGSLNPDVFLPQFIAELEQAGIDLIIAEKQRQLDAWLDKKHPHQGV